MKALAVFGQSLAHKRHEAAAGRLAESGQQLSGFEDAGLPGLGYVVEDGSRLGRLLDQTRRSPNTV